MATTLARTRASIRTDGASGIEPEPGQHARGHQRGHSATPNQASAHQLLAPTISFGDWTNPDV
jgi:hypothetical protein